MNTIGTGVVLGGCLAILISIGRLIKGEQQTEEMRIDKWAWLAYGIKKGWVERYCATHDMYTTPEEELAFEEYDDPCIPILRMKDHSYYE